MMLEHMVHGEEVSIFYQRKAPSVCCIVVEEEIELKPGTEVIVCGKLEPGFEWNYGTPGILEGLLALQGLTWKECLV